MKQWSNSKETLECADYLVSQRSRKIPAFFKLQSEVDNDLMTSTCLGYNVGEHLTFDLVSMACSCCLQWLPPPL